MLILNFSGDGVLFAYASFSWRLEPLKIAGSLL